VGAAEYTVVLAREQAEDERVLLALGQRGAATPGRQEFPRLVGSKRPTGSIGSS
jgi:hypothetical protein